VHHQQQLKESCSNHMEASSTYKRPSWYCFWHRACILPHVHCTLSLVLCNCFKQQLCKNHPRISSKGWPENVNFYPRVLTTKLSILIVIVNCDICWWCRWQEKLETTALRFGIVGNICLVFMFFPVARGSSVLPLLGLTSESSIKYHIWLGHIAMLLFTAHGLSFIIHWAIIHQISTVS